MRDAAFLLYHVFEKVNITDAKYADHDCFYVYFQPVRFATSSYTEVFWIPKVQYYKRRTIPDLWVGCPLLKLKSKIIATTDLERELISKRRIDSVIKELVRLDVTLADLQLAYKELGWI